MCFIRREFYTIHEYPSSFSPVCCWIRLMCTKRDLWSLRDPPLLFRSMKCRSMREKRERRERREREEREKENTGRNALVEMRCSPDDVMCKTCGEEDMNVRATSDWAGK